MRQLPAELKEYFDARVLGEDFTATEYLVRTAQSFVGIKSEDPLVDLVRSTLAVPAGQSWCMDFLQAVVAYVESRLGVSSALYPSQGVLDVWHHSKAYSAVQPPKVGDLIFWQLKSSAWEGHCGIITGMDSLTYSTVEGNTSDSAAIERTGNGCYAKKRARGGTRTFSEVGFLRVFP